MLHYYYDVLDFCKKIKTYMPEEIINHLLSGLRPSLVKKLVLLKLATCDDLLEKSKLFIRAKDLTEPAHGECGRRPTEMEIGWTESGAAASNRAYEELFKQWLKTRALTDTAERAVDQHRGMVTDQPLLAIPARAPVRDDLATMMEQVFSA